MTCKKPVRGGRVHAGLDAYPVARRKALLRRISLLLGMLCTCVFAPALMSLMVLPHGQLYATIVVILRVEGYTGSPTHWFYGLAGLLILIGITLCSMSSWRVLRRR